VFIRGSNDVPLNCYGSDRFFFFAAAAKLDLFTTCFEIQGLDTRVHGHGSDKAFEMSRRERLPRMLAGAKRIST
jgi:hypothetical protein